MASKKDSLPKEETQPEVKPKKPQQHEKPSHPKKALSHVGESDGTIAPGELPNAI